MADGAQPVVVAVAVADADAETPDVAAVPPALVGRGCGVSAGDRGIRIEDRQQALEDLQDPLFSGESAVEAYLPSQKVAIAVAVTYDPEAFYSTTGAYNNVADQLWRQIALQVTPSDPPPIK